MTAKVYQIELLPMALTVTYPIENRNYLHRRITTFLHIYVR